MSHSYNPLAVAFARYQRRRHVQKGLSLSATHTIPVLSQVVSTIEHAASLLRGTPTESLPCRFFKHTKRPTFSQRIAVAGASRGLQENASNNAAEVLQLLKLGMLWNVAEHVWAKSSRRSQMQWEQGRHRPGLRATRGWRSCGVPCEEPRLDALQRLVQMPFKYHYNTIRVVGSPTEHCKGFGSPWRRVQGCPSMKVLSQLGHVPPELHAKEQHESAQIRRFSRCRAHVLLAAFALE